VWSMQKPGESADNNAEERPAKRRRRSPARQPPLDDAARQYFPAALQHMLGPLPIPNSSTEGTARFPLNVTFRAADWANAGIPEDSEGWDVVIAYVPCPLVQTQSDASLRFSITKWIHLNGGDAGLRAFFRRVYDVLRPGGTLVLEPQEWASYSKAWRMDPVRPECARLDTVLI
jgi:7SK snRNA methylphosphate capping enzyme